MTEENNETVNETKSPQEKKPFKEQFKNFINYCKNNKPVVYASISWVCGLIVLIISVMTLVNFPYAAKGGWPSPYVRNYWGKASRRLSGHSLGMNLCMQPARGAVQIFDTHNITMDISDETYHCINKHILVESGASFALISAIIQLSAPFLVVLKKDKIWGIVTFVCCGLSVFGFLLPLFIGVDVPKTQEAADYFHAINMKRLLHNEEVERHNYEECLELKQEDGEKFTCGLYGLEMREKFNISISFLLILIINSAIMLLLGLLIFIPALFQKCKNCKKKKNKVKDENSEKTETTPPPPDQAPKV